MNELLELLTPGRADIRLGVGLLVTLAVTIHVLLTKRAVAASVGWIGLALFAPLLGGLTYLMFGINRVRRRARRLRGAAPAIRGRPAPAVPADPDGHFRPLRAAVGRITGRPLEAGCDVQILHNGDEAYPAMLAAIDSAQHSIGLCSFIMHADGIGMQFVAALHAARARGVQVRVIVDGIGSGWLTSPAYARLREADVPVQRFMHSPMPWRMPFLNLRTHKKILVIDGAVGFTGGINIADQNLVAAHPADPVQDTHFQLRGPVVGQLVAAFARDWSFVANEDLDGPAWFPPLDAAGDAVARVMTAGPDQDLEKIEYAILQAVAVARHSIRIMTPYFLPEEQLVTALSLAAMRGVAVQIIVPERSDHVLVDWAMRANTGPLLSSGVKVWRSPPPFRHSKLMVVDDEWCLIGSSNWDMRSFRLNFELCVELYDGRLAALLLGLLEQQKGRRLRATDLASRSLPRRLGDAGVRLLLAYL